MMKCQMKNFCAGKITMQQLIKLNQQAIRSIVKLAVAVRNQSSIAQGSPRASPSSSPSAVSASSPPVLPTSSTAHLRRGSVCVPSAAAAAGARRGSISSTSGSIARVAAFDPAWLQSQLDVFIAQQPALFANMSYFVQIDRLVVHYLPSRGQLVVHQLAVSTHEKQLPSGPLFLRVVLMQHPSESVAFSIMADTPLHSVLALICKLYRENAYSDSHTKKRKSGSVSKQATTHTPCRFLECSPGFHACLSDIFRKLYTESVKQLPSKTLEHATPQILSFAKQCNTGSTSLIIPISVSLDAAVGNLFSAAELKANNEYHPATLFLYGKLVQQFTHTTSHGIISLSPIAIRFLTDLVDYSTSSKLQEVTPEDVRQFQGIAEEFISVFQLHTVIPQLYDEDDPQLSDFASPKSRAPFSLFAKADSASLKRAVSPYSIVCSKTLQVFPWEVFFGRVVTRHFSLLDMALQSQQIVKIAQPNFVPTYLSFYYAISGKITAFEDARRKYLTDQVLYQLNFSPEPPVLSAQVSSIAPFHSPLVEQGKRVTAAKRKYKYCQFFDTRHLLENPQELLAAIDRVSAAGSFPVMCLSFADLVDAAGVLLFVIRCVKQLSGLTGALTASGLAAQWSAYRGRRCAS
eukprot:TRINITY_DN574_c0_g2_i2.p1 TRINITY_DN574_c0_g2~~TRINITY_DN574_c0_g2_i2.p1  ORF type:complete len:631 (-),score=171.60 TRINITY_DN574_c0_g2_i2:327-2219(-)